jgi:hypothetical protein
MDGRLAEEDEDDAAVDVLAATSAARARLAA